MRFIDEATIEVRAGDGGHGCVSFLRQRHRPKGGPDGGDGGKGGDVLVRVKPSVTTLADHSYLRHFRAQRGAHGMGQDKNGRGGEDKIIEVPPGTVIKNAETDEIIADLTQDSQEVVVARGGRGGKGNRHFATATNRAPRFAQKGEPGEELTLVLELKLLAQVGLVGLPNAGKSSLIRGLSQARPKVADYPFTTLTPNLGVAFGPEGEPITIADIPGLVEGAHQGAGLGLNFLKHIERTRLFLFVVDLSAEDPVSDLWVVRSELEAYDPSLAGRAGLVAANKLDILEAAAKFEEFRREVEAKGLSVMGVSALEGRGLKELLGRIAAELEVQAGQEAQAEPEPGPEEEAF